MTSMGLLAKSKAPHRNLDINVPPPGGLLPGERALVHPPVVMNPKAPPKPQQGDIIRDLLHRLNQQPQRVAPMPEPPPQEDLKSVLRK